MAELEKLRDALIRKSKLPEANSVQAEIDKVRGGTVSKPTNATVGKMIVFEGNAVVPANSPNGFKIGAFQKGDVITLNYITGKWKNHGVLATENPDSEFNETGDASRLVIAAGRYKTKEGPVIAMVPPGTSSKPFSYEFLAPEENVVLRIKEGSENEGNPGSVTYNVRVVRSP